jgi:nicotinamide-nucleotide amidase
MKIEIICIGDELVNGQVQDLNAHFIAKELFSRGIAIEAISLVKDEALLIENQVKKSLQTSDCVILSGGMGHTLDDHTKATIAKLFNQELVHDEDIANDLQTRFPQGLKSLAHQSLVFRDGKAYANPIGTAPMLTLMLDNKILCLLPGVPRELQAMFKKYLLKIIESSNISPKFYFEKLYFCNIKESDLDPYIRKLAKKYAKVVFGIYPQGRTVALTLKSHEAIGKILLDEIKSNFNTFFESESGLIEEALLKILIEKKMTISFAESCSGGAIVSRLTKIAGASEVLNASFVTYSNQMKHELLQVAIETLESEGAVSSAVVTQMAQGALDNTNADVGIAVSGIAGPSGGSKNKPVGTCYICIALHEGPVFSGLVPINKNLNRDQIIESVATFAFSSLYLYLKKGVDPTFD